MAADKTRIIATAPTAIFIAGVDVGYTKGEIQVTMSVNKFDIEVDQVLGAVDQVLISKVTNITIPLAQHETALLKYNLMVASGNVLGGSGLKLAANDDPAAVTCGFTVTDQGTVVWRFVFLSCGAPGVNATDRFHKGSAGGVCL